jgi:hypothetical protein
VGQPFAKEGQSITEVRRPTSEMACPGCLSPFLAGIRRGGHRWVGRPDGRVGLHRSRMRVCRRRRGLLARRVRA